MECKNFIKESCIQIEKYACIWNLAPSLSNLYVNSTLNFDCMHVFKFECMFFFSLHALAN